MDLLASLDHAALYRAIAAHDRRLDGRIFVAVRTTGIYCRPVCRVRMPRSENCTFFPTAARAERDGYRPCLRCRPELAPGAAATDATRRIADAAFNRIQAGALNHAPLAALAREFDLSERQLRRVIESTFGVSPVELSQTQRLLFAKRLLTETALPVADIAAAAGFGSTRRMNTLLKSRYRLTPTQFRAHTPPASHDLALLLSFRPPLAWNHLISFLAGRVTKGVECRLPDGYARTLEINDRQGWLSLTRADEHHIRLSLSASLSTELPALVARARDVLDLDADPLQVDAHLMQFPELRSSVAAAPGLRVPGVFDPFEIALRTVLGQQVSVAAATTISGRFAAKFGRPLATPLPTLTHLAPTPSTIARAALDSIRSCGIPLARAQTIRDLARAFAEKRIHVTAASDPLLIMQQMQEIKGIGPWTAHYFVMRSLHWPDAFPASDLGIIKALNEKRPRAIAARTAAWSPWRSYATMHLWHALSTQGAPT